MPHLAEDCAVADEQRTVGPAQRCVRRSLQNQPGFRTLGDHQRSPDSPFWRQGPGGVQGRFEIVDQPLAGLHRQSVSLTGRFERLARSR